MPNLPQTYTISDFIEWNDKNQLILSPDFQRGSVWTTSAKVFLIDTILNDFPMPPVYFRTKIDLANQTTVREVVDGQQRLRAILEFASGKFRLSTKSPDFNGLVYDDLLPERQEQFLSYKLPVVQLLNATDSDVLEVFARLNSYSVKVTPAELRHAEYSEPVKWAIYNATRDWSTLWNDYRLVSLRDSVRLRNTSIMAEMFMIIDSGFDNGGETVITKYYRDHKVENEEYFDKIRNHVDSIINELLDNAAEKFSDTTFFDAPNFLALFAAIAYLNGTIAGSRVAEGVEEYSAKGIDWVKAQTTLAEISQAFDEEDSNASVYAQFVNASRSSTHRVLSRRLRFHVLARALAN